MTEPDPLPNSERSDTTGSWALEIPAGAVPTKPSDPPTVRSLNSGSSLEKISRIPPAPALPLPKAGEQIDSFELLESIGVGGMGAVFRARDARLDRLVALKILPPEQSNDSEAVQRFYQEGRAAARLDHENIARVFTIGHDSRYHYIAFEYIEGTTIRERVSQRQGPLTVTEAINYTLQIADALVHARERGVVHRDIKPSNIIITPQGRAKLVDMGLARRFESGVDEGLTQSGMTLGTFDYISPEQARDPRSVDVRSDLYSLGCTLFYMLAGHPPFPDGTVLQKLLQHQEETPPDLRDLNPEVNRELSAIVIKLMAKDRERRYQTPEQLARDLLTVAGAMRLRSVSPEGLVWMAPSPPVQPAWERHLIWATPALAFLLIVVVLIWSGPEIGRVVEGPQNVGATKGSRPSTSDDPRTGELLAETGQPVSIPASPAPKIVPESNPPVGEDEPFDRGFPEEIQPRGVPRSIRVDSTEDLLSVIIRSPRRATLVLTDAGPYRIRGNFNESTGAGSRLNRRELTIKAEPGIRPVIRFQPAARIAQGALLDFVGGKVEIEGIEFDLESEAGSAAVKPVAAIRVENTELTLRRCSFRRTGAAPAQSMIDSRACAIRVVNTKDNLVGDDRPPALVLDRCHFDPDQVGILATGPIDLVERDCTIAAQPAVWLDDANADADTLVDSELTFRHVSFLAGSTSVFRFNGSATRVRIDDCVIAPAAGSMATVVAESHPEALQWEGRGNLYAKIETFLLPIGTTPGQSSIRDAAEWTESGDVVRERGSRFLDRSIWNDARTANSNGADQAPAVTFRLVANLATMGDVGARESLTEPLALADQLLEGRERASRKTKGPTGQRLAPTEQSPSTVPTTTDKNETLATKADATTKPGAQDLATLDPNAQKLAPMPMPTAVDSGPVEDMPIMPRADEVGELATAKPGEPLLKNETQRDTNPQAQADNQSQLDAGNVVVDKGSIPSLPQAQDDSPILRSPEQLRVALSATNGKGGILRVPADADWEIQETTIRVDGSWRIQAVEGKTRPKLRFKIADADPNGLPRAMFDLRGGSLQLDGFDIVLPLTNAPSAGGWTAFKITESTDLGLNNCSVTIEGDQAPSSMLIVANSAGPKDQAVLDGGPKAENAGKAPAATARLRNSLLRSGGDLVQWGGHCALVLDLDNVVVSTAGSLLHAMGDSRVDPNHTIAMTLRSVTTRNVGGLAFLESSPENPKLPITRVNVRDSIVATNGQGAPLLRVEGQGSLESLQDQIVWEGLRVGYHQISVYRRDQTTQFGALPRLYDRQSWMVAVGVREMNSVHGDMMFRRSWARTQPAWSFRGEDAEVDAESPASSSGPVLSRLPRFASAS